MPAWKEIAGHSEFASLNIKDSEDFIEQLMTLSPEEKKKFTSRKSNRGSLVQKPSMLKRA